MKHFIRPVVIVCLGLGTFTSGVPAQSFGAAKAKVTLQRKLPALVHLTGNTIKVRVTGRDNLSDLTHDLAAFLETELLKDDPRLRADDSSASTIITCQVTDYSHPQPTVTQRPSMALGKNAAKTQAFTRVTGSLSLSFQARTAGGQTLVSDNVTSKYDEEFDSAGNDSSHGVKGTVTSAWKRVTGGAGSEDLNPPTDAELRSRLMTQVVRQIAEHIVNTNEVMEVYLAKAKGPLDEGDKQAEAGLWQRALETYEMAPQLPKPVEDAYRLYDIGVAYEALAYAAEDEKSAMKFLDEAAINYGKAIDAKPAEKYFLDPQRRIETAIAHYKELDEQRHPKVVAESAPATKVNVSGKPTTAKGLTNAQVISMVKSGMEDDTVIQAIHVAKVSTFDLSAGGQQQLASSGVSTQVVAAMKARAARKTVAAK
jgi:tetratricopeptide (TPR) repeat protein